MWTLGRSAAYELGHGRRRTVLRMYLCVCDVHVHLGIDAVFYVGNVQTTIDDMTTCAGVILLLKTSYS